MSIEARHAKEKTTLTTQEKIKAAYLHECRGIAQHVVAEILEVNPGRVATAIKDIREAANKGNGHDV
jgi:hypothetical protein